MEGLLPERRNARALTIFVNLTRARGGCRVRSVFSFLPFRSAPAPDGLADDRAGGGFRATPSPPLAAGASDPP